MCSHSFCLFFVIPVFPTKNIVLYKADCSLKKLEFLMFDLLKDCILGFSD